MDVGSDPLDAASDLECAGCEPAGDVESVHGVGSVRQVLADGGPLGPRPVGHHHLIWCILRYPWATGKPERAALRYRTILSVSPVSPRMTTVT